MLKFAPKFFLSLLLSKTLVWSSLRAFEVYLYFFRRIVETSHPRNEENFRRRKHQEPKYLTLCKEKERPKQLYMT
jgi:hypothetical protein